MKVKLSFGHKAVISSFSNLNVESKNFLSLSKRNIKSENFFYKSCLFCYPILEYDIKIESLALNWSNSSHFVTFCSKHQIENKDYKSCLVLYAISEFLIKSESEAVILSQSSHFVTFYTNHQIKKLLLQKLFSLVRMSDNKW